MQRFCSIFSQLLQLFPRTQFEQAGCAAASGRAAHARLCVLGAVRGDAALPARSGAFVQRDLRRPGRHRRPTEASGSVRGAQAINPWPTNSRRPWQLYETVFEQLLGRCQSLVAAQGGGRKFRFKNRLLSLDATVIDLCLSLHDWAHFRRTKGAVKLHLLLDHDGYLPTFAVVTEGKSHELKVARRLVFEPGAMVVFDRAYTDYEWFADFGRRGVFFVTRLKKNADYSRRTFPAQ